MTSALLELSRVYKSYENHGIKECILDDISLTVNKGDFLCIMGPSGSGKSTLLSLMGLLDVFDRGRYQIKNRDVSDLSDRERAKIRNRHIGFVFQSFNLISELSLLENVALPLRYAGKVYKNNDQRLAKALECLKTFNFADKNKVTPEKLSGGQQQRVAIARALVMQPDILLLDEPTGNLDSKNANDLLTLLLELNSKEVTLVLVTHDMNCASYASRLLDLQDGKLTEKSLSVLGKIGSEV